jgi:hypothetical protein
VLVEKFIDLACEMTRGRTRITEHYRRMRSGEAFARRDAVVRPDWDSLDMASRVMITQLGGAVKARRR